MGPLRIPAGGAIAADASSACRQLCIIRLTKKKPAFSSLIDRAAPLSALCNGYHSMADRPLLRRSAALHFLIRSRSATAALRVVSCREAVRSLGRGRHSLRSHPDCRGNRGTSAAPNAAQDPGRDPPAGPPATPPADPSGRPASRQETDRGLFT